MAEERNRAALFDVDGTLVDTSYLHAVTWWEALRQAGHTVPMARVHRAVGLGTDQVLERVRLPTRLGFRWSGCGGSGPWPTRVAVRRRHPSAVAGDQPGDRLQIAVDERAALHLGAVAFAQ